MSLAARLDEVRQRLAAAAPGAPPGIVAVTKGHPPDAVDAAVAAGLTRIGESYAQEALGKAEVLAHAPEVHMVGRIQRNKIGKLAPLVDVWESVDRLEVIDALARRAPGARILIQVDHRGNPDQGGCRPDEAATLAERGREAGLVVEGLMTIAPQADDDAVRATFAATRALADRLGLVEASMGMSGDYELAAAEGATLVRLGTTLFGPRPS